MSTLKRKRSGIFSNSTGSLTWDPIAQEARSYRWYVLAKRINGVLYLNTYGYSVTTSKHVSIMRRHFERAGIEYRDIEAPRGLQDLETAMNHAEAESRTCFDKHFRARKQSMREMWLDRSNWYFERFSELQALVRPC